jgi:hypothetical protein
MIRNAIFATLALALASVSQAQTLSASELEVDQAFKNLRNSPKALFRMIGAEYFGSTTTPIASDLFWDRPSLSTAQDMRIELIEARNGLQTHRIVADGRHVWWTDLLKNTYSVARYGSYTAAKPADYEQNGLQSLNVFSSSQSALISRMTREVWGGLGAQYRPWIPPSTARSEFTVSGGAAYTDPVVNTRTYTSTPTKTFHIYWNMKGGVAVRSLTFELDQDSAGAWNLTAIYYSDRTNVGPTPRLVDWKTDVYTTSLPAMGNFTYAPPAGARAVAGPRPNGSG